MQTNTHKIGIVGGGAGGLELATRLGKAFGRGTQAHIGGQKPDPHLETQVA